MNLKDITKWNARVSLVYAIGIWTMFGTYGYYQMNLKWQRKDEPEQIEDISPDEEVLYDDEPEPKMLENEPKGPRIRSTVVYRENFVPYSTRVLNFIKSLGANATENNSQEK